MTKYLITYHGNVYDTYNSLDELLADEHFFKKMYQMATSFIIKYDNLTEEEKKTIDARSWEVRDWGFYPKPNDSLTETIKEEEE